MSLIFIVDQLCRFQNSNRSAFFLCCCFSFFCQLQILISKTTGLLIFPPCLFLGALGDSLPLERRSRSSVWSKECCRSNHGSVPVSTRLSQRSRTSYGAFLWAESNDRHLSVLAAIHSMNQPLKGKTFAFAHRHVLSTSRFPWGFWWFCGALALGKFYITLFQVVQFPWNFQQMFFDKSSFWWTSYDKL